MRLIGAKSATAIVLATALVTVAVLKGKLSPSHLAHLSPGACFAVGLLASLALGLAMAGWRPERQGRGRSGALAVSGQRERTATAGSGPQPESGPRDFPATAGSGPQNGPRELPATAQRLLVLVGFVSLALVAIDNHAAARIADYPRTISEPSASEYCLPAPPEAVAAPAPAPPPPPEEQPGCALVKRAYQLGYRKTLGDCAPRQRVSAVVVDPKTHKEVCVRRQLDEPWLHYAYRKVAGGFGSVTTNGPITVVDRRTTELRTHLDYLQDRLADIKHSITGTPHAAHHLWINLPDPHPGTLIQTFIGAPRCEEHFEHLPLWPAWTDADRSRAVEHVLGQLLFAARFGTTASCSDYVIHWDAPADACTKLAADPIAFLDGDALASVRGVLDRRRRQIAIGKLAKALARPEPRAPAPVSAVVSLHCFVVDPAGSGVPSGKTIAIDGDELSLREVRVAAVKPTGSGPIDIYRALAALFAGTFDQVGQVGQTAKAGIDPALLDGDDFLLTRFDALADADPFRGARWPLDRPELAEVYPYERHLRGVIDTFRRRYLSQRGRL